MVTKQWYAAQENLYNSLKINKFRDLTILGSETIRYDKSRFLIQETAFTKIEKVFAILVFH